MTTSETWVGRHHRRLGHGALRGTATMGATALIVVACGLLLNGLWIPAKAVVAQVLLERAWLSTLDSVRAASETTGASPLSVKPWSWADTWPVARLTIGSTTPLIVLHGDSGQALAFGPGLVNADRDLEPDEDGVTPAVHLMIAGHRDTHFKVLETSRPGTVVTLELPGQATRNYVVKRTFIVHRNEAAAIRGPSSAEVLTLVTCYPFRALITGGPLRFVVQAERVS